MGEIKLLGTKVYIDTNIFIYALENDSIFVESCKILFQQIDQGLVKAVTSELTLAEALVKPILDQDFDRQQTYEKLFQNTATLQLVPIDRKILIEAARIRVKYSLRLPDAIHVATAYQSQSNTFLTNDLKIKAPPSVKVVSFLSWSQTIVF